MSPDASADDREARRAALDVSRSFIVQAPAGSGKTELLVQRYLALLATVDAPEEVLAITFTRKAAQEMQLRVINALEEAAGAAEPTAEHRRTTIRAARQVLARSTVRDWGLTESPRRLRIQTLDALNAGIAASLPLSSGLGGAARLLADEEIRAWYGMAAAATLDWLAEDAEAAERRAIERVLGHLGNDTDAYVAHLTDMLAMRDQWLPLLGAGLGSGLAAAGEGERVRRALERNVATQIAARLQSLRRRLPPGDWPEPVAAAVADWCRLAELLLTKAGRPRRSLGRGQALAAHEAVRLQDVLGVLTEDASLCAALDEVRRLPEPRYEDEQWSVLQALFRLLPIAAAELRRLFRAHGVTDYVEVASAADRALGSVEDPGDVALLLDYGIRHLLVDEMQDTSLAQYRLLEKLVAGWQPGDGRTLFCVGDPMQSIYRFRDAEVGQFLLAREQGIGGVTLEPLVLRRNFRSGAGLVSWFNSVFAEVFPAADDIATGAIPYTASVAAVHGHSEACHVHAVIGADPRQEAAAALAVIERCLADYPADESVAVLVRSRGQLAPLLERLRAAGIAYQAVEIDRLTDVPEIIELRALARALCHRGDRIAWLALLRAPWVGLTWADLHALVRNDTARTVWELLHDELRIAALSDDAQARVRRFAATLAPFLDGHGLRTLRETVERAWYALGGPLLLDAGGVENCYRFLDVLERNESAGTLPDPAELEALLDRERVQSGRADARLQIMTIHRAKGLEFDHVVLYGLGRGARGDRRQVLSWLALPGSGADGLLISPIGAHGENGNDRLHAWIEAAGQEKDRLEQDRLLYVACTRARSSLHVIGHAEPAADGERLKKPSSRTLLGSLWPAVHSEFEAAFARTGENAAPPRERSVLRRPRLRRLAGPSAWPSPAELPGTSAGEVPDDVPGQPVTYDWVGALTRHTGTLVHRWLKRVTDSAREAAPALPAALAPVTRRWAVELGVPAADLEAVCSRVRTALERILADSRGRWLLSGPGYAELPITGHRDGRVESVVLDRVRIDDDGVHWIVDYKSSVHEGGDLPGFLAQETARYRPQLEKYAQLYAALSGAPVRTALYFPLLAEFVPVSREA